jgi:soluble lytic murein transglycosylase-like protein/tetratricopeptide (TPR) repeat protein
MFLASAWRSVSLFSILLGNLLVLTASAALPGDADYLRARDFERAGQYAPAIQSYGDCINQKGLLTPYAKIRLAACRAAAGDMAGAQDLYGQVIAADKGPWTRMAQTYLAALFASQQRFPEAGNLYQDALRFEPHPWWVGKQEARAAEVELEVPAMRSAGLDYYRNVCASTRWRTDRMEAIEKLLESPSDDDRVLILHGYVKSAAIDEAKQLLAALAPVFLQHDIPAPKLDFLLHADWKKVTPDEGTALLPLVKLADKNQHAMVLATYAVRMLVNAKNFNGARTVVDGMVKNCPGKEETGDALWTMAATLDDDDAKLDAALAFYRKLGEVCPKHFRADDALIAAARLYRDKKQTDSLVSVLKMLTKEQPDSIYTPNAWYWLAEIYQKAGKAKESVAALKSAVQSGGVGDFYAHCALDRLRQSQSGEPAGEKLDGAVSFLRAFSSAGNSLPEIPQKTLDESRCRRLAFFGANGLEEAEWEALAFVDDLRDPQKAPAYFRFLAENGLAATALDFAKAVNWDSDHGKPGAGRVMLDYPRAYWPAVTAIAEKRGIDPYLLLSVARQESTFRPALTSWAGACGVMQVMPGTAEWLVKKDPEAQKAAQNLNNPANSILLGSKYLRDMLVRSDDNLIYALASYNAGPGNCDKWRVRFGNSTMLDFIEKIPYSETRWYVKAVLGNYAAYKSLYHD